MNLPIVLVSAVVAFIVGGLWYSPLLFGRSYLALRGLDAGADVATPPLVLVAEFVRWLLLSAVLASLMSRLAIDGLAEGLIFGATMWAAIYLALSGSVIHEGTPWRLFAIHAGDGLVKVLAIAAIVATWGLP